MPQDPRCPQCSGKIGARAQWCMHCGAEFGEGGRGPVEGDPGADPVDALLAGDLPAFAAHLDEDSQLRGVVVVGYGVLTWYLLSSVVLPSFALGYPGALLGGLVALAVYQCDTGADLLVKGLYLTAAGLIGARLFVLLLFAGGQFSGWALFAALVHGPTLVTVGLLIVAGRGLAQRLGEDERVGSVA